MRRPLWRSSPSLYSLISQHSATIKHVLPVCLGGSLLSRHTEMPSPTKIRPRASPPNWPPFVVVIAAVLLTIGTVLMITQPGHTQEDDLLDAGNGRSAIGGVYLNRTPPSWYFPLLGARHCSERDGYLCGIGIRLGPQFFLASIEVMMRVQETLDTSTEPSTIPSVFFFNALADIDISQYHDEGYRYRPQFNKTYAHGIALYKIIGNPLGKDGYNIWRPLFVSDTYPLTETPVLEDDPDRVELPCRALVYSHRERGADGLKSPKRKYTAIAVQKMWCKDGLCRLEKSHKYAEVIASMDGLLCGLFSSLATPVVCGNGEHQSLQYIISNYSMQNPILGKCNDVFYGMEVASYQKQIAEDVKKFVNEEYDYEYKFERTKPIQPPFG